MVDIHSHILPNLDDGSESMEESLSMAMLAAQSGINHIVASSHGNYYPYTMGEYKAQFSALQKEINARNIPVTLYPAMEIYMDEQAVSLLESRRLLSINHTRYVLIEFPFEEDPEKVCRYINILQSRQYHIVLAHPERYLFMQRDPELAYMLEERGCVLQVNKGSILGDFGQRCQALALQLLDDGIARVIATDAHDTNYRSPSANRLVEFLNRRYTPLEIRVWLSENPSRILKDRPTIGLTIDRKEE